jgi:hypothetical protein
LAAHAARDIDKDIGATGHAHNFGNGGLIGDVDLGGDDLATATATAIDTTSRSQAMTRAPSLASDRAIVWPMPRAAPATIAVRPSNRISMGYSLACSAEFCPSGFL